MYKPYGIIPPLITPFDAQGHVDFAAMARMAVFLVDGGVHGLFPFGTTGEFYALDDDEYVKGLETVRDAVADKTTRSGRPIQLLAGCSHITTREVIRLIKLVEQVGGYDAVSVLTPMFISQTQEELYTHYRTIAESTTMPVLMYNNPPKTNVNIAPATAARLAHDCGNIIGIKDSSGDMTNCGEYLRLTADVRDHFQVIMGRDTMIYAGLHYGCSGAVASCANVAPRVVADIYDKYMDGDWKGALEAQFRLAPLRIACSMGTFPEVIKEGLTLQGIPVGKCLDPIQELTAAEKRETAGRAGGHEADLRLRPGYGCSKRYPAPFEYLLLNKSKPSRPVGLGRFAFHGISVGVILLDAELFDIAPQGGLADAQLGGHPFPVAVVLAQQLGDLHRLLVLVEHHPVGAGSSLGVTCSSWRRTKTSSMLRFSVSRTIRSQTLSIWLRLPGQS